VRLSNKSRTTGSTPDIFITHGKLYAATVLNRGATARRFFCRWKPMLKYNPPGIHYNVF
jgi:hypothetical protein